MTAGEIRAHLRALVSALPDGAAVSVPRAWLVELLGEETGGPDLTVGEFGTLFRRSASTVRAWAEEGRLEGAYKLAGRSWRIPRAAVAAFRAAEAERAPAPAAGGPVSLGAWRSRR